MEREKRIAITGEQYDIDCSTVRAPQAVKITIEYRFPVLESIIVLADFDLVSILRTTPRAPGNFVIWYLFPFYRGSIYLRKQKLFDRKKQDFPLQPIRMSEQRVDVFADQNLDRRVLDDLFVLSVKDVFQYVFDALVPLYVGAFRQQE